ncbi:IS1096 element passenger TnpR family protein [Aminobacter sp. BE322]|uniref:IS1096 element passenger TnpR family protein n=1 Tax=unclassified Aminobacter TaxID=2644704 RepID=UPI003D1AC8C8
MTDDRKHDIRIEAGLERQLPNGCPTCIGGRGNCPPEECDCVAVVWHLIVRMRPLRWEREKKMGFKPQGVYKPA